MRYLAILCIVFAMCSAAWASGWSEYGPGDLHMDKYGCEWQVIDFDPQNCLSQYSDGSTDEYYCEKQRPFQIMVFEEKRDSDGKQVDVRWEWYWMRPTGNCREFLRSRPWQGIFKE